MLLLRQQLAKSSIKKYQPCRTPSADGRARGMFNIMVLHVLDAGQAGIYNYKTFLRTISLIWKMHGPLLS